MSNRPCLTLFLVVAFVTVSSIQLWSPSHDRAAAVHLQNPSLTIVPTRGTVGSRIGITLSHYPPDLMVQIRWNGQAVGSVHINDLGVGVTSLNVPNVQKGTYLVEARNLQSSVERATFEVAPRIKVSAIPGTYGAMAKVSLTGYAPRTVIRIRWLIGSTWVEVARVTTSGAGSASIDVVVPSSAPEGLNAIRGDAVAASGGRAQTNAYKVLRPIWAAESTATHLPTPSATLVPTETTQPTAEATATPSPTATTPPTATPTPTPATSEPSLASKTPSPEASTSAPPG